MMAKIVKKERLREMYEAILTLQDVDECIAFFEDLCLPTELSAMEQRYEVMNLLLQDKVYLEILEKTSASTATISRVKRVMDYGTGCMPRVIQEIRENKE